MLRTEEGAFHFKPRRKRSDYPCGAEDTDDATADGNRPHTDQVQHNLAAKRSCSDRRHWIAYTCFPYLQSLR